MTHPIVIDVIGRDRTGAAMKSAAESQKNLAKQIDATNRGSDNLRKSQLGLIAAQERYNKVAQNTGSSVGQLASAQKGLITAQQRVATETRKATTETEKFGNASNRAYTKFTPLVDAIALLGPALVPIGAAAVAAGAGLAGLGAAGLLAFKGIQREMKAGTDLGKQYQATFAPVVDEFHQLEHIAAANVFGGINRGIQESRTLFPQVNQDVGILSSRLGDIAGNVGVGLVGLFHQLNPLFLDMADFVDKGSAAFQRWAQTSDGPKKFVAYAQATLPTVERTLSNVAKAVEHLVVAAAPLGGAILQAISALASAIARIPVPILTALIAAFEVGRLATIAKRLTGVASGLGAIAATPLGPLALIVAGTYGLSKALQSVTDKLPGYLQGFASLTQSNSNYSKNVDETIDQLQNNYVAALKNANGSQKDVIESTIAAGKSLSDVQIAVFDAGGDWGTYAQAITGTDEQYKTYIDSVRAGSSAQGISDKTTKQFTDTLDRLRQAYLDGKLSAADYANAVNNVGGAVGAQNTALQGSTLTLGEAQTKFNDAFAAAHTLTAELGYMSTALDTQSNNLINATLGQDQLNLAIGTSADKFAASRAQVKAHGLALEGNTADAISNRGWALQQILAINQQAISYAKSSGSIDVGTDSLKTNEDALRASMKAAGFTDQQIKNLIDTYGAVPGDIKTSIEEQGSAAVLAALGDILNQLHAIADPVWGAKFDFAMNNPSLKRGFARGGPVTGPGSGTSDSIPAWLSSGEYVVNAAATQKHLGLLENINRQKYAGGGLVGNLNIDTFGLASEASQFGSVLGGALADAAKRAAAEIAKQAAAQAAKAGGVPGAPGSIPANVGAYQAYAGQLMAQMGMQSLGSLIALWNGESGWNPNALNASSGAYGIPQALPADKMASAGADWHSNAQTQIRWGLGYIRDRYGSPDAAWSFWQSQSPHWYGRGLAPTVFSRPTLIGVGEHGPETVSVSAGRYGGAGVVVAPGAITVYAARGQDERAIAAQAFTMLRAWVAEEERKAAKGGRA